MYVTLGNPEEFEPKKLKIASDYATHQLWLAKDGRIALQKIRKSHNFL